jgi:hypothetical protein
MMIIGIGHFVVVHRHLHESAMKASGNNGYMLLGLLFSFLLDTTRCFFHGYKRQRCCSNLAEKKHQS